ncbi:methyl-accepting chemotaxis protein [Bacillus sp. FJAT-42315]|uniref:methyl-accepting chemotaxis protein n=1 Tax=Bacillus sp. FJAT-42315 TaxID=2014077 RepID=UPI000C244D2F|nr:methyl-accepting chemotaxis protein [Bacillus sp. FJAT-42315]
MKNKTIKTNLIALCLILLAVPSLLIGSMGFFTAKGELNKAGEKSLKNDVRYVLAMITMLDQQVKDGKLELEDAQEQVKETILGKKNGDGTRPISDRFDLGENGYVYIIDDKGNEIAHPFLEGENIWDVKTKDGTYASREIVKLANEGGGFIKFNWPLPDSDELADKITYTEKDPHWGWIVNAGTYMMDFNQGANKIIYTLLLTLGIALIIGSVIIVIYSKRLVTPIMNVEVAMKEVAHGNLLIEKFEVKNKDEIGRLAIHFQEMTDELKEIIHDVRSHSEQVAAASEQLSASSEETSRATEQISSAMQDIFTDADQQSKNANETAQTVTEMKNQIVSISQRTKETVGSIHQTSKLANEGKQSLTDVTNQMKTIDRTVDDLGEVIEVLYQRSKDIASILQIITDIAEQTNLLALNASIEAARAGEHGKGFAVVASEVRKLAEQSTASAQQITEIIRHIQGNTLHAKETMSVAEGEVKSGIHLVDDASTNFGEIRHAFEHVLTEMDEIASAAVALEADTLSVVASVNQIADVSAETSSNTETIAAATEEQMATMEQMNASSLSLAKLAQDLQLRLGKFKA